MAGVSTSTRCSRRRADDRTKREESERFKKFAYDDLLQRDKVSLDITWLRDESLDDR
jgi:type I restriction enzyme M protein